MSFTKACCTLPPVSSDYVPQGSEVKLGDLPIYEAKDKTSKVMLICAYDIFGYNHSQIKQFSDKLNSTGLFRVVLPDFFRGNGYSTENFPPKDFSEVMHFATTTGSWDKVVKPDVINIIEHYKKEGVTAFGLFGFCWGGKMAIRAVCEVEAIKGAGLIHPSMIQQEDVQDAKAPVLFIPTKDEPDMIPFYEIVKKNLGEGNTEHYRFDDVFHGFAGARGDWKNDVQRKRVDEAISLVHNFFKKHLI